MSLSHGHCSYRDVGCIAKKNYHYSQESMQNQVAYTCENDSFLFPVMGAVWMNIQFVHVAVVSPCGVSYRSVCDHAHVLCH